MAAPVLNKKIEKTLRIAIMRGGTLGYNPDMYKLGFADNIPPSSKFNAELEKYGKIEYDFSMDDDFGFSFGNSAWNSFTINEYGRSVIKEIDKERNGIFGIKKILRGVGKLLLGFLEYGIGLVIFCVAAYYLASIDSFEEYTWYSGIWHALFFVPNFIMHYCYDQDILYFAESHTAAYTFFYWADMIIIIIPSVLGFVKMVISDFLKGLFKFIHNM